MPSNCIVGAKRPQYNYLVALPIICTMNDFYTNYPLDK